MRTLVVAAAVVCAAAVAEAHEYRTVTWYADHPAAMREVLRLCRNNAGLAPRNPNCINAEEAGTLVVERQLAPLASMNASPTTPAYWRAHPVELRHQLWTCAMIDKAGAVPDPLSAQWCSAARSAGQ